MTAYRITLSSEADKPNRNGHIFPRAVLEEAVKKFNEHSVPVVHTSGNLDNAWDKVPLDKHLGDTVPGTAKLENGRVVIDVELVHLPEGLVSPSVGFGGFLGNLGPHPYNVVDHVTDVHHVALCDPNASVDPVAHVEQKP